MVKHGDYSPPVIEYRQPPEGIGKRIQKVGCGITAGGCLLVMVIPFVLLALAICAGAM